jgi:hypothetical protein
MTAEGVVFVRGEAVDVDKALGESLCEQDTFTRWTPAKERKTRARAAEANPGVESRTVDPSSY